MWTLLSDKHNVDDNLDASRVLRNPHQICLQAKVKYNMNEPQHVKPRI